MISRRDTVKLGTTMLSVSSVSSPLSLHSFNASPAASVRSRPFTRATTVTDKATHGPSLDRQIGILWAKEAPFTGLVGTPPPENELLYVPTGFAVTAISLATGESQWEAQAIQDGTLIHHITDEVLIVTSQYRVALGGLQVFDALSGDELWRLEAGAGGQNPPAFFDNTIYIGIGGNFMALDAATGAPVWAIEHAQGYPIVQDDSVYIVCHDYFHENGDVLAIDRENGEVRWRVPRPEWPSVQAHGNTLLLLENDLLFMNSNDAGVQAINVASGEEVWRYSSDQQIRLQAISSGVLYLGGSTTLLALHSQSGEELWRFDDEQHPFVERLSSAYLLVSAGPALYALDPMTGTAAWQFAPGQEEVFGSICADEQSVFITGQNLYGLDAATGNERMRYPLPIDPFFDRGSLVIGQGCLFLEYGSDQIFALGNVGGSTLLTDVVLRAAPSPTSPERGKASAGEEIETLGTQSDRNGETWVEATVNGMSGWILLDSIDPSTLPQGGDVEVIYTP